MSLALTKNSLFDLGISFWQTVISSMEMKFRFTSSLMIKSRKWLLEGKKIGKTVTLIKFGYSLFHLQTIFCIFWHNISINIQFSLCGIHSWLYFLLFVPCNKKFQCLLNKKPNDLCVCTGSKLVYSC